MREGHPAGYDQGLRPPSALTFSLVALFVPLLLAAFALWLAHEYALSDDARQTVRVAFDRRVAEVELISLLKDAETGQRGYVITGDQEFLGPYVMARTEIPTKIESLRKLSKTMPMQLERLERLRHTIDAKFAEMDSVMLLRRAEGEHAAISRVRAGTGRELMDQARDISAAMVTAEDQEIARSRDVSVTRTAWIKQIVWTLVAAVAVILALVLYGIWRARRARYLLQVESADSAQRVAAIFSGTIDAMVLLNPSGTIEIVNRAATTMLGYGQSELLRRDVSVLLDIAPGEGTFHERIGLVGDELRHPRRSDCVAHHKDGHEVPVDIALGLMPLPDGMHIIAAIRDVSERKAVERMKDEFISTVSHELRTPLTSIVGSLGLLRAEKAGVLPDAARRLVEIAENNSRRLIRLINDILDIEKMGSGQMRFETAPVDLCDLIRHAAEGSEGLARANSVTIDVGVPDAPIVVRGDQERLLQVITNLMSNAVRFTPAGGTVQLLLEERDRKAVVMIDDQGPGIPPDFRERVFARFAQAQTFGGPAGGTGLGLAISSEIIRAHDGTIWFEDRPGGGARFAFSLDVLRTSLPNPEAAPRRVLIVEDDEEAAETLRAMVAAEGYVAKTVGSVREAEAAIAAERFDAMLLDMNLPDGRGLGLIRSLRTRADTEELPIVVVSGSATDGEVGAAAALEMIDWLHKPVDQTRLSQAVRVAVSRSTSATPTLLHVDDDVDLLDVTAAALDGHGRLLRATSVASARAILQFERPDIVILDMGLPDGSGADLMPLLRDENGRAIPTIVYSAQEVSAEVGSNVQAVLVKSRRSLPNLAGAIQRILSRRSQVPPA